MKQLLSLILITIGVNAFADGKIVYVDVEQVYAQSKIINSTFNAFQESYQAQKNLYIQQQGVLESQIDVNLTTQQPLNSDHLALQEKQLQESVEALNKKHDQQVLDLKNSYIIYVRKAAQQLYNKNHYQYVISSNTIIAGGAENNISAAVTTLADKLYTQDKKVKQKD